MQLVYSTAPANWANKNEEEEKYIDINNTKWYEWKKGEGGEYWY